MTKASKEPKKEIAIEKLLEREKNKNRRIVTAVIFAAGILIGMIAGYFQAINLITDSQSKAVSVVLKNNQ